jgi:hypothetical protein
MRFNKMRALGERALRHAVEGEQAMSTTETPVQSPVAVPPDVQRILAQTGKGRDFLSDGGLRNVTRAGTPGFEVQVRLTSYRALPLSCIEGVRFAVDGETIDASTIVFSLNGYSHKLADLAALHQVWWFILEHATLFVPHAPLAPGTHSFEATLITVEPYVTAGRFSFYNFCNKDLRID